MTSIDTTVSEEFGALVEIWEASVRATHKFLTEQQIVEIRPELPRFLPLLNVLVYRHNDEICGFIGLDGRKVEMLFVSPAHRGKSIGKALLEYAVSRFGADSLDVNEQNEQALGFYLHMGFRVAGRSERDSAGRPLPLLHMRKDS